MHQWIKIIIMITLRNLKCLPCNFAHLMMFKEVMSSHYSLLGNVCGSFILLRNFRGKTTYISFYLPSCSVNLHFLLFFTRLPDAGRHSSNPRYHLGCIHLVEGGLSQCTPLTRDVTYKVWPKKMISHNVSVPSRMYDAARHVYICLKFFRHFSSFDRCSQQFV